MALPHLEGFFDMQKLLLVPFRVICGSIGTSRYLVIMMGRSWRWSYCIGSAGRLQASGRRWWGFIVSAPERPSSICCWTWAGTSGIVSAASFFWRLTGCLPCAGLRVAPVTAAISSFSRSLRSESARLLFVAGNPAIYRASTQTGSQRRCNRVPSSM